MITIPIRFIISSILKITECVNHGQFQRLENRFDR
jgi:hypothetical protein